MFDLKKVLPDKHFHHQDKGCNLEKKVVKSKSDNSNYNFYYCRNHKVRVCKCGWEIGWHDGQDNKNLEGIK